MSNSPLVNYTKLSPNHSGKRNHAIDTITIHCVVGQCSVETLGSLFSSPAKQASSNYGIGFDGRIGMYVEEENRSWCSSNAANDHRAVTIEVASDTTHPYAVTEKAHASLLDLVTDICKRNKIEKLLWKGDKSLIGQVEKQNMTVHRWFAAKACPGDWLYSRHGAIAAEVNKRLEGEKEEVALYKVQVGAFKEKGNADKLCSQLKGQGFSAFVTTQGGQAMPANHLQVGDRVRVKDGAKTYDGNGLASFVYQNTYDVQSISGDRVVIGQRGTTTAAVHGKDLVKV